MTRNYNFIYSQLVEDKADIIGHIAYALYKEEKISYIEKIRNETGVEPTEDDIKHFNIISSTPQSVDKYRFIATSILNTFLEDTLKESINDIEKDCKEQHLDLLKSAVEPLKPKSPFKMYCHGIMQSVLGAFTFSFLLCGIVFLSKFSSTQYTFTFGGNGNATLEENRQKEKNEDKSFSSSDKDNNNDLSKSAQLVP